MAKCVLCLSTTRLRRAARFRLRQLYPADRDRQKVRAGIWMCNAHARILPSAQPLCWLSCLSSDVDWLFEIRNRLRHLLILPPPPPFQKVSHVQQKLHLSRYFIFIQQLSSGVKCGFQFKTGVEEWLSTSTWRGLNVMHRAGTHPRSVWTSKCSGSAWNYL